MPEAFDCFNLFKQIVIKLPIIDETSQHHCRDIVRATFPTCAQGRSPARSALSDFAFIQSDPNPYTAGTPLQRLRIGKVRVIFALPSHFGICTRHPLAYVEWCTELRAPDTAHGLFTLTHSSRMGQPN